MATTYPGETPFAIDGTGQVVRPGDAVIVSPRGMWTSSGPAVVKAILDHEVEVSYPFHEDAFCRPCEIRRADDHERTPDGSPLWCWL
jgi:hypothetical protein